MNENNEGTISISSNMSGEYPFTVLAFDWAGNQVTLEKKILIDNVRPTVNLVTDKTSMYSYENAEIIASASDEGSGLESFKVTINDKEVELNDEGKYIFKTNIAGNYTIKAEAIDKAGNITITTKTINVREDTVKPTVNLSVNRTSASIGNEIIIKSSARDNAELVSFEVTLDGEKIDLIDGQYSFIADKAKDYTVQAIAKDRAGNETIRTSTIKVTEDTTKPTLSLNVNSSNVDYGDYIDISLIANDNVGIESLKLYVDDKEIKIDENNSARILADVLGNLVIKAEATDKAGNITTRTRTIKVNIDTTKPTINLNVIEKEVTCGEYVNVSVNANDNKGIESLKLYANSKEIKIDENGNAKILTDKVGDLVIEAIAIDKTGNKANEKVTVKVLEKDIINPTINITSEDKANLGEDFYVSVGAEDNVAVQELKVYVDGVLTELDGNKIKLDTTSIKTIKIKAVAKDTSGNETIEEKEVLVVDTINPIVSIETDKSSYKEGESAVFISSITDNGNIAKVEAELNGKLVVLDEENKFKIDNLSVGTYTLSIKAYDESGNTGENIKVITIKDEIAPTITINKDVEEYTKGQSISVNYSISDNVKVNTIQASLNNKVVEISELSGNLVFNDLEEGEYTLKIQASDEENNKSEESYNFKVVIPKDTIAPKLNVSYTPEITLKQNGSIKINATDETELDRVELYLGETKLELNEDNSYTYTPTEAGEFTFTAKAIDKAGNESKSTFKINVKKYASEQEEFEETVAEYLVTASEIVDIYEKMGVSQENLKLLLEEAARREKGEQPLANKSNLMTNSVKSSLMTDSIEYKNINSFSKTNLNLVKAASILPNNLIDEEMQKLKGKEEKKKIARRMAHCLYIAKKRNYPSNYVLYLYISHYIDTPDGEPLECRSGYLPDIISSEDVRAYEKFMSNVNMSEFADNLANFAADAYTLGTTDWNGMLNNAANGLKKAEDMWGWFCADDAMNDMTSLVEPMVDYIMENKFHQYARSSEEIVEYLNSAYQSNVDVGKTAMMVTGTVVFGIISGGAILMPVSVIIGAEYVGFYTDLVKIAALVGLRYGLSGRAAIRTEIFIEEEYGIDI